MNIYNISAKESFVDVLSRHFLNKYKETPEKLAEILFLLPNRRSCQSLADAFVRQRGGQPTILPRMEPIADVQEDEIFLDGNAEVLQKLKTAVDPLERVFNFTRMILCKNKYGIDDVSLPQAYALALNLAAFIDTVQNEDLDFAGLKNLVPEEYSEHWRKTLKLLQIITEYWPRILSENEKCDPMERRKQLLKAETDFWRVSPQRPKIVLAGITAAYPFLREAVKTVAEMDSGEVYLYGLDKYLDEDSWQCVDENHPQYELKALLEYLKISRDCIPDIGGEITLREKLISEVMRPAATSGLWRELSLQTMPAATFDNIHLINCDDARQEAKTIALIMRETLEIKEKTVALVTMDRNLARRVSSELRKWGINADDSAGQPLSLSHIGVYFRLIGEAVIKDKMTAKTGLMKYPFTSCGKKRNEYIKDVYHLEQSLRKEEPLTALQEAMLADFEERLRPLKELYNNPTTNLKDMLEAHIKAAESLADTDEKEGGKIIWRKEDGRAATKFFVELINKSDELGEFSPKDYIPFLTSIMTQQNVRLLYGFHPRVKILGPIEARLVNYDRVIIGSVNEGVWPKMPQSDMWLSRPMKTAFGMPQAEKNIGVCAADFAHLLHAKEVYLTRAQKADGAPTDKSRWWQRLETILEAVFGSDDKQKSEYTFIYNQPYSQWAKNLERCYNPQPIKAPAPKPDLQYRPRKLSASQVEILMRDPYSIYAKKILNLYPLPELDRAKEVFDFGNIVHETLEEFCKEYNSSYYPPDAAEKLMTIGLRKFAEKNIEKEVITFWRPRLQAFTDMIIKHEKECRPHIKHIYTETEGAITFKGKNGDFLITGKADRLDETDDGYINVIDYKTGKGRSTTEMEKVTAPQLPVEALIVEKAGFKEIGKKKVSAMSYWALKGQEGSTGMEKSRLIIEKIDKALQNLIDEFDNKERPYLAKPILGGGGQYGDYDHLSRFLEWSVRDDKEESNKEEDDDAQ